MIRKPLLVWQLTDRGFCSEINLMLFAYLYSLEKGFDFVLCSDSWNSSHILGWKDYFQPFCQDISKRELEDKYLLAPEHFQTKLLRAKRRLLLSCTTGRLVLSNNEIWQGIWNREFTEETFCIPKHNLYGDCFSCCQNLIRKVWRLNDSTQQAVLQAKNSVDLGSAPYAALHIRRGDKIKEAKYTPSSQYIKKVQEINRNSTESIERFFVMTDDYKVVAELEHEYPNWQFFSLCNVYQSGHDQSAFNLSSPDLRRDSTIKFLSELYIAQESTFFVGTYSSNICRFLSLFKGKENTHSVDIPFTMFYEPKLMTDVSLDGALS